MLPETWCLSFFASLICVIVVLSDIMCYLGSAKNRNPNDDIIKSFMAFYDDDAIIMRNMKFSSYLMRKK